MVVHRTKSSHSYNDEKLFKVYTLNFNEFCIYVCMFVQITHFRILCDLISFCLFFQMALTPQRWDKLSPSEFQQLQDLASCEYNYT